MNSEIKFRLALILTNMTFKSFAEQHGLSKEYISQIISGKMNSKRIETAVADFIKIQMIVLQSHLNNDIKYNQVKTV